MRVVIIDGGSAVKHYVWKRLLREVLTLAMLMPIAYIYSVFQRGDMAANAWLRFTPTIGRLRALWLEVSR